MISRGGGAQLEEKGKLILTQVPLSILGNELKHSKDPRIKLSWQTGQLYVHRLWEGEVKVRPMMHPLKACISPPPYSPLTHLCLRAKSGWKYPSEVFSHKTDT